MHSPRGATGLWIRLWSDLLYGLSLWLTLGLRALSVAWQERHSEGNWDFITELWTGQSLWLSLTVFKSDVFTWWTMWKGSHTHVCCIWFCGQFHQWNSSQFIFWLTDSHEKKKSCWTTKSFSTKRSELSTALIRSFHEEEISEQGPHRWLCPAPVLCSSVKWPGSEECWRCWHSGQTWSPRGPPCRPWAAPAQTHARPSWSCRENIGQQLLWNYSTTAL